MAEKTLEQLQREVLETQLETAKVALEKTQDENAEYRRRKQVATQTNANRQSQFRQDRATLRAIQKQCQHMSGGDASDSPLEGGGKFAFAVLTKTIMPDGKTERIACPRCRLVLNFRPLLPKEEVLLKKQDPEKYDDYLWWKELRQVHRKEGIKHSVMRGPTFNFAKGEQQVPFIPDASGYATSGAGGR